MSALSRRGHNRTFPLHPCDHVAARVFVRVSVDISGGETIWAKGWIFAAGWFVSVEKVLQKVLQMVRQRVFDAPEHL